MTTLPGTEGLPLPDDLRHAIAFHGHLCPGVLIGWHASRLALAELGASRAEDEELLAIVENDSCSVDGVQALTGCTFGKGNLLFRDHGKQVFTFALRPSGRAVRLSYRHEPAPENAADPDAPDAKRRRRQVRFMLEAPPERLFDVERMTLELPERARGYPSIVCDACGEPTMEPRLRDLSGRRLCPPCAAAAEAKRG